MEKKRIVVTGIGLITPIGTGEKAFWAAAIASENGVRPIQSIDVSDYKTKTGGEVLDFNSSDWFTAEESSSMGRSSQFAVAATRMALADAGISDGTIDPWRVAVSMGTTMGEPQILDESVRKKYTGGSEESIPADLPRQYPCGVIPANISRMLGFKGPSVILPAACAAGNYAIGYAMDLIRLGRADVVIAGGSDPFSSIAFTGFNRLLATTKDVCRPFDKERNGMAVSEGAGILIIESLEHALARKARIRAELLGYGIACDAFHMTTPAEDGCGGILASRKALDHAGVSPDSIDYVCAHGTGTPANDKSEAVIAKTVFGDRGTKIPMSSIKSMLGHTMGAASAIEAAACILMLENDTVLPTINYENPDPLCDIDCVPNKARSMKLQTVMSNAYAFAGNTSAIILSKFKGE